MAGLPDKMQMQVEIEPLYTPKGFAIQVIFCFLSGMAGGLVVAWLCL